MSNFNPCLLSSKSFNLCPTLSLSPISFNLSPIFIMKHNPQKIKDFLRPALFWDVDYSVLNLDDHAAFVIVRVMERGNREEVRAIWNYFGADTIKQHLLSARSLSPKTISYFANQFKIQSSQFRSAIISQDQVNTWP